VPRFDVAASATGITLDRWIGTLNESGKLLIKGFNPINPRRGDAIIATFFWVGSTNIIDSVTDVLTLPGYPPVGNKYRLVEYSSAGGISMATYVATNVQNFPGAYSNPSQDSILAVRADLSTAVVDGGLFLSSWTGVASVDVQALGAHRAASGSGTTTTVADPGAISVDAGALAYGVTMANALVGLGTPPSPFANIASLTDASLKVSGDYAVVSAAGTVDPQWMWSFDSPSSPRTWLATVLALRPLVPNLPPTAAFTSSCSGLTCSFTSTSTDPDGSIVAYSWDFGDGAKSVDQNPSHTYPGGGTYPVTLAVTDNQGATNSVVNAVIVNRPPIVDAGPDEKVLIGALGFTENATFSDPDNDGPWSYTIDWGDGSSTTGTTSSQGTISKAHNYLTVLPGSYTLRVTVTDSHGASGSDTKVVSVGSL
jgi:PKD repeat protein